MSLPTKLRRTKKRSTIFWWTLWARRRCVPKWCQSFFTEEQKVQQLNACQDILPQLEADDKVLESVITGDDLWVFQYDPETKRQSRQWKSAFSSRPKKVCMQRSQVKVRLITFFDHRGLVHHEFFPQGRTVNQLFYKKVLTHLFNKIRQKRSATWARKTRVLHHGNASAHTTLLKQFLISNKITTLHHPPYSPDLAFCDFILFLKLKRILKGTRFEGFEDITTSVTNHLKIITNEEFSQCFQAWTTRIEKCIKANGE